MTELGFTSPGRVLVILNKAGFGLKSLDNLTREKLPEAYRVLEEAAGLPPAAKGDGMFDRKNQDDDIPW